MLSKTMLRVTNTLSRRLRLAQSNRKMSDYAPALKEPHMNDIPLPTAFSDAYNRRQKGNNFVLAFGLAFFAFSFFFVSNSGAMYTNPTPPKKNPTE